MGLQHTVGAVYVRIPPLKAEERPLLGLIGYNQPDTGK